MSWKSSGRSKDLPIDWNRRRRFVLARDNHECQIRLDGCTSSATEVDHIVRGNDHSPGNLRAACRGCHARKSSLEGHQVRARMRSQRKRPKDRHPGQSPLEPELSGSGSNTESITSEDPKSSVIRPRS